MFATRIDATSRTVSQVNSWVNSCCVLNREAETNSTALYRAYVEWAGEHSDFVATHKAFSVSLLEVGDVSKRKTKGLIVYRGIVIRQLSSSQVQKD